MAKGASVSAKFETILNHWEERLIDLSKSNPLLGLNRARNAKFKVLAPDPNSILKKIVDDESKLTLPFVKKSKKFKEIEEEIEQANTDSEMDENKLFIVQEGDLEFEYKKITDLRGRMRRLYDNSHSTINERGINTLFLTFGLIEWEDDLMGHSVSPLLMVPCELINQGGSKPLQLAMADEDMQVNPAIKYYFKDKHKIELPDLPDDLDSTNIDKFFKDVQGKLKLSNWVVKNDVWLGTFSFEYLAIYQDLKFLENVAAQNNLVKALAHLEHERGQSEQLDDDLDSMDVPKRVPVPLVEADSSQLTAMTYAANGANLVIHGPPGTGKSQTISGIIADALSNKKTILFVSAKMAALNVVYDRLKDRGFDRFCLEAHGVKSGKRKVVEELKRTLEAIDSTDGKRIFDEELRKLIETRTKLNEYVNELHDSKNNLGLSLYEAIGKYEKLQDTSIIKGTVPWENILDVKRRELDFALEAVSEIASMASLFADRKSHPFRGFEVNKIQAQQIEELERALILIQKFISEVLTALRPSETLFIKGSLSINKIFNLCKIFLRLSHLKALPENWAQLSIEDSAAFITLIKTALEKIEKYEVQLHKFAQISKSNPETILPSLLEYQKNYPHWYNRFSSSYRDLRNQIKDHLQPMVKFSPSLIPDLLAQASVLIETKNWLAHALPERVPHLTKGKFPDKVEIGNLLTQLEVTTDLKREYSAFDAESAAAFTLNAETVESLSDASEIIEINKNGVEAATKTVSEYWPKDFDEMTTVADGECKSVKSRISEILPLLNIAEMRKWQKLLSAIQKTSEIGLMPFIEKVPNKELENLVPLLEKRFYSLWIDATVHAHPMLSEFNGQSQTDLIAKFRILDSRVRELARLNAITGPSETARKVKTAQEGIGNGSQVGILRIEMEKRKRLKPLRALFNEIPQVLQALKPCMLMSPLSVSTFLKPEQFRFDIVIFDEASQLPTPEAIPSILRGKQIVVAGDSNQLPPTSFFRSSVVDEDEESWDSPITELESLLDDCKAAVPTFQETHLKWHYRSRDERLISFSNHYYYENRLITFPSVIRGGTDTGVVLEYVSDGVWDRGGSRTNRKEARRTAELIVKHFETNPEKSLGVVAMNSSQKEAIEDALSDELQNRPDLAPLMSEEKTESFFIKSLENVQGDERDVIIISVGYAKSADGRLTYNFGPINAEGGWRRLNVLVTRAKWKTVLITSLKSSELTGINEDNKGATGLRNYIAYAEQGSLSDSSVISIKTGVETNDFEDSVQRELENRGYKVDAQVGVGKFRIDLAVRHPNDTNRYAIGVECDGATYHSSRVARDRDLLRQEILQNMGWKLCRVWSTEWFYDKEAALNMLLEHVNRAISGESAKKKVIETTVNKDGLPTDVSDIPAERPKQKDARNPEYEIYTGRANKKIIINDKGTYALRSYIEAIVEKEGPIHRELLAQRLKEVFRISKIGANVRRNVLNSLKAAIRVNAIQIVDKDFYAPVNKVIKGFRLPSADVHRSLDQICAIEIQNAIIFLIKDQFGLSYEHIPQSVQKVFQLSRTDPAQSDRIREIADDMVARGLISRHGNQVNLTGELSHA